MDNWSNDPDRTTRRDGSAYGQDDVVLALRMREATETLLADLAFWRLCVTYGVDPGVS